MRCNKLASGLRFGKLIILKLVRLKGMRHRKWKCRCDCGRTAIASTSQLISGHVKSCGCKRKENVRALIEKNTKHGMCFTRAYNKWHTMRQRCNCKTDESYHNYGGRGIKICARWNSFSNFLADMGEPPVGATLGRIDNDGNYEPKNCRWETYAQQANNRRDNILLTIGGQTLTARAWYVKFKPKASYSQVLRRIRLGWSIAKVFSVPPFKGNKTEAMK